MFPLCPGNGLDLGQKLPELAIVDLHTIIQVETDTAVGIVAELLIKGLQFCVLLAKCVRSFSSFLRCDVELAAAMSSASWSRREAIFPWSGMTYSVRIRDKVPS